MPRPCHLCASRFLTAGLPQDQSATSNHTPHTSLPHCLRVQIKPEFLFRRRRCPPAPAPPRHPSHPPLPLPPLSNVTVTVKFVTVYSAVQEVSTKDPPCYFFSLCYFHVFQCVSDINKHAIRIRQLRTGMYECHVFPHLRCAYARETKPPKSQLSYEHYYSNPFTL